MQNSAIDDLQKKLLRDEERLKELKDALKRSSELHGNIAGILDNFQERIGRLSETIAPLYQKTNVLQRKQQNVKKLLNIIDASIQFYGKTMELENSVRDRSPAHNLDEFLERMESLSQAMAFFRSHSAYAAQRENMKQTFESGRNCLESEFVIILKSETMVLDPMTIVESLDADYELMNFRLTGMKTIKNTEKLNKIATWMMKNASIEQLRTEYANVRSENINKTMRLILNHQGALSQSHRHSKQKFFKSALKKAGWSAEQQVADAQKDGPIQSALLVLSAFLILTQLETEVCTAVFQDVSEVANVFRKTIAKPLHAVLEKCSVILQEYEGSFGGMLPMAKFALRNANQLQSLAENVNEGQIFAAFSRNVFQKTSQLIDDFISRLVNDHSRKIPEDGNVHEITAKTVNFVKMLAKNGATVHQILNVTITSGRNVDTHFSRLFAHILSALGTNLKTKATIYPDEHLAALFMLNNFNYVYNCLQDEAIQSILNNEQLLSFYRGEVTDYMDKYLKSWARVTAVFSNPESRTVKTCYSNFNKEFDAVVESQNFYCFADSALAREVRKKIKEAVLRPYQEFTNRHSSDGFTADRQIKYDVESVEIIIDRLTS